MVMVKRTLFWRFFLVTNKLNDEANFIVLQNTVDNEDDKSTDF